jgi:hypothetical protein
MEGPNTKFQINFQSPKFEKASDWSVEIGIWGLLGIWNL